MMMSSYHRKAPSPLAPQLPLPGLACLLLGVTLQLHEWRQPVLSLAQTRPERSGAERSAGRADRPHKQEGIMIGSPTWGAPTQVAWHGRMALIGEHPPSANDTRQAKNAVRNMRHQPTLLPP